MLDPVRPASAQPGSTQDHPLTGLSRDALHFAQQLARATPGSFSGQTQTLHLLKHLALAGLTRVTYYKEPARASNVAVRGRGTIVQSSHSIRHVIRNQRDGIELGIIEWETHLSGKTKTPTRFTTVDALGVTLERLLAAAQALREQQAGNSAAQSVPPSDLPSDLDIARILQSLHASTSRAPLPSRQVATTVTGSAAPEAGTAQQIAQQIEELQDLVVQVTSAALAANASADILSSILLFQPRIAELVAAVRQADPMALGLLPSVLVQVRLIATAAAMPGGSRLACDAIRGVLRMLD